MTRIGWPSCLFAAIAVTGCAGRSVDLKGYSQLWKRRMYHCFTTCVSPQYAIRVLSLVSSGDITVLPGGGRLLNP